MSERARKYPVEPRAPAVLAVDVGGSHVKAVLNGVDERRRFASGHKLTAEQMVDGVLEQTADWDYVGVSVGVPGAGRSTARSSASPSTSGTGWAGFDFEKAFGKPTKVINDAAMQALGSYEGGRMLFLGLGTGLGTTMILDGVLAPMELGHLAVPQGDVRGLRRRGRARARRAQALEEARARDHRAPLAPRSSPTTSSSAAATRAISASCRRTAGSGTTRTRSSAASASGSRTDAKRSTPASVASALAEETGGRDRTLPALLHGP